MKKLIPVFLEGEAKSVEISSKIANAYQDCPYVAFMATKANKIMIVYFLPEKQRWWVESIEKKPQTTLGLEKANLVFPERLIFPKKMKLRLPKRKAAISPCNSDCMKCPAYNKCLGCPATINYKGK